MTSHYVDLAKKISELTGTPIDYEDLRYNVQEYSQNTRYLVVVPRTHKRTSKALPAKVYTPIASLVKPVEDGQL